MSMSMLVLVLVLVLAIASGSCDGSTVAVETYLAGEFGKADAELNRYYRGGCPAADDGCTA